MKNTWKTFIYRCTLCVGLPGGADHKESACRAGKQGLILTSARSPGEGNSCPLQYSYLENPMDTSLAGHSSWGSKQSDVTE